MTKQRDPKLQTWHVILLVGVIIVAIVLGIVQRVSNSNGVDENTRVVLTEASCTAAGGTWNACGSACRGQENEEACIQVCVEYCECTSDNQCPYGSECVDYIDDVGVCTNTF